MFMDGAATFDGLAVVDGAAAVDGFVLDWTAAKTPPNTSFEFEVVDGAALELVVTGAAMELVVTGAATGAT